MLKTMNAGSTEALPKEAQSAGASFLEVLAGTSSGLPIALPADSVAPASSLAAQQGDSESTAQGGQPSANDSDGIGSQESTPSLPQAPIALQSQNPLLVLTQSTPSQPQAAPSTANPTSSGVNGHTAGHAQKVQPADQQTDANVQSLIDPASIQPVALTSVPVPAVPSPEVPATASEAASMRSTECITATVPAVASTATQQAGSPLNLPQVAQEPAAEFEAVVTPHIDIHGQDSLQVPSTKADNKAPAENAKQSTQPGDTQAKPASDGNQEEASNSSNAAAPASAPVVLEAVPVLPGINLLPDAGDLNQVSSKTPQNGKASDPGSIDSANVPDALSGTDAKKISAAQSAATSAASSSPIAGNNQGSQRIEGDGSQMSGSGQKSQESGAQTTASQFVTQVQAIANHDVSHDTSASHVHADGIADAARTSSQQLDGVDNASTSAINTANVIQKMSETEMHVGMRSVDFGEVSIRTLVSQQQMTAQISVDHSDLGKAISAHIPAMEAKIGSDLGLRTLVEVSQGGMAFSGERGFSSQRDQRSFTQPAQNQNASAFAEVDQQVARVAPTTSTDNGYRLDIRA